MFGIRREQVLALRRCLVGRGAAGNGQQLHLSHILRQYRAEMRVNDIYLIIRPGQVLLRHQSGQTARMNKIRFVRITAFPVGRRHPQMLQVFCRLVADGDDGHRIPGLILQLGDNRLVDVGVEGPGQALV